MAASSRGGRLALSAGRRHQHRGVKYQGGKLIKVQSLQIRSAATRISAGLSANNLAAIPAARCDAEGNGGILSIAGEMLAVLACGIMSVMYSLMRLGRRELSYDGVDRIIFGESRPPCPTRASAAKHAYNDGAGASRGSNEARVVKASPGRLLS